METQSSWSYKINFRNTLTDTFDELKITDVYICEWIIEIYTSLEDRQWIASLYRDNRNPETELKNLAALETRF